jgi:hypothetical protein
MREFIRLVSEAQGFPNTMNPGTAAFSLDATNLLDAWNVNFGRKPNGYFRSFRVSERTGADKTSQIDEISSTK